MPAPYSTQGLTPERTGRVPQNPKGPVLQSTANPPQQQQAQGGGQAPTPDQALEENASGWENFFGFLRENPQVVAFLGNAAQAMTDPNNQGDPGSLLRAGFQGMANYETILQQLSKQQQEGEQAERKLELEATRIDQSAERNSLVGRQIDQRGEQFETEMEYRERELDLLARKYDLDERRLKQDELSPEDAEKIYDSIFSRNIDATKEQKGLESLTSQDVNSVRRQTNAELLQFRPDLVRFDPNWSEDMIKAAAQQAVEAQAVPQFMRDIYLQYGPQARDIFRNEIAQLAQAQRQQGAPASAPEAAPAPAPAGPQSPPNMSGPNAPVSGTGQGQLLDYQPLRDIYKRLSTPPEN